MNTTCLIVAFAAALSGITSSEKAPEWKPAKGPLATRWTSQVDPRKTHPEYPRPQMVRPQWVNLNGLWEYAIRAKDGDRPSAFDGRILVPFPIESALSGVMKPVKPDQRLWYRRTFELAPPKQGQRWLLHFGAVDWDSTVIFNGRPLGEHRGGYDPFTFDITEAIAPSGAQELVVSVWDPTDAGSQPRGKQVLKPGGIMYTANTGIWQTVWLEPVPEVRIDSLKIVPDVDTGELRVAVMLSGVKVETRIVARAFDGDREVASAHGRPSIPFGLKIPNPKLWSPDQPFLYGLRVAIEGGDEVSSYFGMRKIALAKDESGINRLFLNGKPLFQLGPLDQGWWPDGLYTAPTDEALKYDLDITRQLGFNMIRKHVKVEPDRWYYWCDTMGILVWQDMPSGDNRDAAAKTQFALELERMIDARRNHPSIVMWVPFNEGWGQHDTPRYVEWIKRHDPTRLVDNASGWTDTRTGDVVDLHNYPGPGMPPTEQNRAAVLGEFGGLGLPLENHVWVDKNNWGYRTFKNRDELTSAYQELIARLRGLEVRGLSAGVYTQTTDCEVEVNGLMTYDRAVIKLPVQAIAQAQKSLYLPLPAIKVLVPTAETAPQTWSYTTKAPDTGWTNQAFDDSTWSKGKSGFGTKGTPGALVHTDWKSSDIWLRRSLELESYPLQSPQLLIHHDEDAEICVNGKHVAKLDGFTTAYGLIPLGRDAVSAFKPGRNLLAVHCHQTVGGQYIDVGLVDLVARVATAQEAQAQEGDTPNLRSMKTDLLVVTAHPDDESMMAATMARYVDQGKIVGLVTCTHGEGGGNSTGKESGQALGMVRETELRQCLRILGVHHLHFLNQPDFAYTESVQATFEKWGHDETLRRLVRVVRLLRPEVICTMDPAPVGGQHGHHQAAGRLATEAFEAAADPTAFPELRRDEGLAPWRVRKLYWSSPGNTATVRIETDGIAHAILAGSGVGKSYRDIGWEAARQHRSQGFDKFLASLPQNPASRPPARPNGFLLVKSRILVNPQLEKDLFDGIASARVDGPDAQTDVLSRSLAEPTTEAPVVAGLRPRNNVVNYREWLRANGISRLLTRLPARVTVVRGRADNRLEVEITNYTAEAKSGHVSMAVPDGWTLEKDELPYAVPAHGTVIVSFRCTVPDQARIGSHDAAVRLGARIDTGKLDVVPALTVRRLATALPVDANPAKWRNEKLALVAISDTNVFQGTIKDAHECSARFFLGYDDDGLQVLVEVTDDTVAANITPDDIKAHWRSTSVEICLDPAPRSENTLTTVKLGILPRDTTGTVRAARDADARPGPLEQIQSKIRIASRPTPSGYIVEANIPWSETAPARGRLLRSGDAVGFNIILYHAGKKEARLGEDVGKARLAWSFWPGVPGRPEVWGMAFLE